MTKASRPTLVLKKLSKRYRGSSSFALEDLSLTVRSGEIFGFLGPNGAGKTTTIRLIMDFIRPTSGSVSIFGKNVANGSAIGHADIGFLSADSVMYPQWTAQQHIDFVSAINGDTRRAGELAKQFGLDLQRKYHRLSSGNKQKLALVLALMNEPKVLILDEPTRGLDPLLQQELYAMLRQFSRKGGTVFMSSHNLGEVEHICDRVGIIKDGKLVASETMQSLRRMHIHEVTVVFAGAYNRVDFELQNVEIKKASKTELVAHVRGDLNGIIRTIGKYKVHDVEITHVSLEEMFLRYYQ